MAIQKDKKCIVNGNKQFEIVYAVDKINKKDKMQVQEKKSRISRVKLRNIASPFQYKPVTERNYLFGKVKRNSTVLSRTENLQDLNEIIRDLNGEKKQGIVNYESMTELITKRHSVNQVRNFRESRNQKRRYSSAHHSMSESNGIKKKIPKYILPQVQKSKEILLNSSNSSKAFDDSLNSSKNQIEGTKIGVLSTKEIIKKYQIKKLNQQMNKKKFLDEYIQNLKPGGVLDIDDQTDDNHIIQHINGNDKSFVAKTSQTTNLPRSQSINDKDKNLVQRQQRLVNLLQDRLTDRDFIDLNVKLFEKRDINKKKFFQRYHHILKQQRKQIAEK